MQSLIKISQQTVWQVLGKVVTSFSTFIILGLVARNYGPNGTGIFTLALTYLAIFYLLADFGFNAHELKRVKRLESRDKEWNKLLGTRVVWSGILIILAIGLLPFWPFATAQFNTAVFIGSLAIAASAIFITCNLIFQSKLRYDLSVIASSIGTLVGLVITVWLISSRFPVSQIILGHLIGWVFIAASALILCGRLLRSFAPRNDKQEKFPSCIGKPIIDLSYAANLFKQSWPIAATLSLNVLYFRADSFLIAYFKSVSDAGIYNVAYSFFQTALVLPTFIMNAYYPLMLKSLAKVKVMGLSLLGISLLGTVLTLTAAPLIIKILTGGGFAGSTLSLQILSLGFPAYFLSSLLMWIFVAKNKYKTLFLLYTSGTIFNILLNIFYIPKYSYIASSWITVISEYFILILQIMVLWFAESRFKR